MKPWTQRRKDGGCLDMHGGGIFEFGPLGTGVGFHERPQYNGDDIRATIAWLEGREMPLPTMVTREADPWDPARPAHLRGTDEPYPWIAGRTRPE